MTTQTLSLSTSSNTAAAFRAWGSAFSAALATAGFVKTADTGQIDWTTATAPASGATVGQDVWRFADALQATAPIYFRFTYGAASTTQSPAIWLTVGTGTDGAGNLTGTNIAGVSGAITPLAQCLPSGTNAGGSTGNVYVSSDGSSLCLGLWLNLSTTYGGGVTLIERTRAWDGTPTGDGVIVVRAYNGNNADRVCNVTQLCYLPGGATNSGLVINTGFCNPGGGSASASIATCAVNNVLYPYPVPTTSGPRPGGPSQYLMAVCLGDYPQGNTFAMTHYGVSRTWYSAGQGNSTAAGYGAFGSGAMQSFIMRIS